ncbi:TetR/AcrR family transcriptional regulator [Spiribacter halobius]|uniref:TetR family transcriptional regulator n=1 Tax=Sediminicurvatus halobius TaxID=2182432 RepID=A0A2U2N6D1_9GAMM|nr:TetR/AcrR family transcriptional regulator [Spiribacter halobius]PWG64637.1 TetR family transcriptional regulator [Spiribacter halobius]UEX79039.1 TetR/AcrR family transcriptional regulator [Spiribacter halobius]
MARGPRQVRGEAVDRAMQLFWRRGYHATSLKALEQALDMRPGSIYASFGSKEGLFREALASYAERGLARLRETLGGAPSPLAGLRAYVRELAAGCRDGAAPPACLLVKTVLELGEGDAAARREADAFLAAMESEFERAFAAARAAGELPDHVDPTRRARQLQMQIIGLRSYAQRAVPREQVTELAEEIIATLLPEPRDGNNRKDAKGAKVGGAGR